MINLILKLDRIVLQCDWNKVLKNISSLWCVRIHCGYSVACVVLGWPAPIHRHHKIQNMVWSGLEEAGTVSHCSRGHST